MKARFVSSLTSARVGWNGTCAPFSTVTTALGFGGWEGRGRGWRVRVSRRAGSGSRRRVRRRLVVRIVDLSAPGAHLPLAADERPDACHVADVRARTRSGHLLLGLKNARREEREAQADAGKPTRDSHERVRRATQSEPRGDEVRTHRRDRATTAAELRTLIGTASFAPDFDAAGGRFARSSRDGNRTTRLPASPPRHSSQGSQSGFFHPNSPVERFRQENLTFCRVLSVAGVTAGRHNGSRGVTSTRGWNHPSAPELRDRIVVRRDTYEPLFARDSNRRRGRVVDGSGSSRRGERTRRDSHRAA